MGCACCHLRHPGRVFRNLHAWSGCIGAEAGWMRLQAGQIWSSWCIRFGQADDPCGGRSNPASLPLSPRRQTWSCSSLFLRRSFSASACGSSSVPSAVRMVAGAARSGEAGSAELADGAGGGILAGVALRWAGRAPVAREARVGCMAVHGGVGQVAPEARCVSREWRRTSR